MNKASITFVTLKGSERTVLLYFSGLFFPNGWNSADHCFTSEPLYSTAFSLILCKVRIWLTKGHDCQRSFRCTCHRRWWRSFSTLMAFVWWLKRMLPSSARKASWRLIFHQHITTSSLSLCLLLLQHHTLHSEHFQGFTVNRFSSCSLAHKK